VPPELTAVLAALAVQASPGDFAAAERLLGGSFSGLADVRRNPVATIDAAELTCQEVRDQLSGLPIGQDAELHVAWIAERLGARMSFATFTANAGDLWFPAMDDIACVLHSAGQLLGLVLDHEELITLSRLGASHVARHPGHAGHKRGVRDGWPGSLDGRFLALLALVRDGSGLRDARQLDLLISARYRPREGRTVLDELIELERRGLVRREAGGTGYRWTVTDAGSEALS
jgi:hypothetical protein